MRKVFNLIGIDPHRELGRKETRLYTLFTYYLSLFLWHNNVWQKVCEIFVRTAGRDKRAYVCVCL